ncbi:MAG: hypothetical protein ABIJ00_16130 [Candidatus Eisenbacteria bacterium]
MRKLTRAKSIRAKCLDCTCYQYKEVRNCETNDCPLWPYRLGHGYEEPPEMDHDPDADFDSETKSG